LYEREMCTVERFMRSTPTHGALERGHRIAVALRQKQNATERPPVKCAARRGTAARGHTHVREGGFESSSSKCGARCILMKHIGQDVELEGLMCNTEGLRKTTLLEVRKIQLAQKHCVRRRIERLPRGETFACKS